MSKKKRKDNWNAFTIFQQIVIAPFIFVGVILVMISFLLTVISGFISLSFAYIYKWFKK